MFEELLAAGHAGRQYDAWMMGIMDRDQFGSGFVSINPNSKIPALARPVGQEASAGVGPRGDPAAPCREVRRLAARAGLRPAGRVLFLANVADGDRAVAGRRLRPLLPHQHREAGICDRSLCHGSRDCRRHHRPTSGGQPLFLRQGIHAVADVANFGWLNYFVTGDAYGGSKFLDTASYQNLARWVGGSRPARRACGAGWWSIAAAARGTLPSGTAAADIDAVMDNPA